MIDWIAVMHFIDNIPKTHFYAHFTSALLFGLVIGNKKPARGLLAAAIAGFVKEMLDVLKHRQEWADYNFLTHPQYGIFDAIGDWSHWVLGGLFAYLCYRLAQKRGKA